MKIDDIFSGKVFKKEEFGPKEPIQYGPLPIPKFEHPADELVKKTNGWFPYEANGLVEPDLTKSEYLKS